MANVRKFLDLSTAHLTVEQRLYGDRDGDRAAWGSAVVDAIEYGFRPAPRMACPTTSWRSSSTRGSTAATTCSSIGT